MSDLHISPNRSSFHFEVQALIVCVLWFWPQHDPSKHDDGSNLSDSLYHLWEQVLLTLSCSCVIVYVATYGSFQPDCGLCVYWHRGSRTRVWGKPLSCGNHHLLMCLLIYSCTATEMQWLIQWGLLRYLVYTNWCTQWWISLYLYFKRFFSDSKKHNRTIGSYKSYRAT